MHGQVSLFLSFFAHFFAVSFIIPSIIPLLFGSLIFVSSRWQLAGLPPWVSVAVFGTKCSAAIAYIVYYQHIGGGDAYHCFENSQYIVAAFHENPYYYFRLVFGNCDTFIDPALFKYTWALGYWNDPASYSLLRFHALLRPFTGGNYAAHSLIMATLLYAAGLQFYKICYDSCRSTTPNHWRNWGIAAAVFGIPSLVFWISGVHKDGFIYGSLSLIAFGLHRLLQRDIALHKGAIVRYLCYIALGIFGFSLFRSYLLAVLLPSIGVSVWLFCFPRKRVLQYIMLWLTGIWGLYAAAKWANLPVVTFLAAKQNEFRGETGNSDFFLLSIGETWQSLLRIIPIGFTNALLRPFVWSAKGGLQIAFGTEALIIISLAAIIGWLRRRARATPLTYFLMTYALCNLLLIGILVSNAGTMVRYRAIAEGLLLLSVLTWRTKNKGSVC